MSISTLSTFCFNEVDQPFKDCKWPFRTSKKTIQLLPLSVFKTVARAHFLITCSELTLRYYKNPWVKGRLWAFGPPWTKSPTSLFWTSKEMMQSIELTNNNTKKWYPHLPSFKLTPFSLTYGQKHSANTPALNMRHSTQSWTYVSPNLSNNHRRLFSFASETLIHKNKKKGSSEERLSMMSTKSGKKYKNLLKLLSIKTTPQNFSLFKLHA